jgi:hypothetical protein
MAEIEVPLELPMQAAFRPKDSKYKRSKFRRLSHSIG